MQGETRSAHGDRPPAIVVGGAANALSVARSLGRRGIPVYALNAPSKNVRHSRYCRWIRLEGDERSPAAWERFLLGPESDALRGAVLLLCNDEGIEIALRHRERLAQKFLLEEADDGARRCLLDKLSTYRAAARAGVPTPRWWPVRSLADAEALRGELRFPLILKPVFSHRFERAFGVKYLSLEGYEELREVLPAIEASGLEVALMEFVPGGDDRLCSYYTFLDAEGKTHFHFTKRILRRYPTHMGGGCYHVTDWNPEVMELGLRLFREVGLRGLGNVEFKRDPRDGQLKLIECNARFTAANGLVAAAGLDLASFVYDRLTGGDPWLPTRYREGLRLWWPWEDFHAFRELQGRGELSWAGWLASIARPQTLPYFAWDDPLPTLATEWERWRGIAGRRLARLRQRLAARPAEGTAR